MRTKLYAYERERRWDMSATNLARLGCFYNGFVSNRV